MLLFSPLPGVIGLAKIKRGERIFSSAWPSFMGGDLSFEKRRNISSLQNWCCYMYIVVFFLIIGGGATSNLMLIQGAICWVSVCSRPSLTYAVNVRIFKVHVLILSMRTQTIPRFNVPSERRRKWDDLRRDRTPDLSDTKHPSHQ